jgi:hypothetical protein
MSLFLLKEDSSKILEENGTDSLLLNIQPIVLSASANISAGGSTATTAQLTAPSGKTTSNFQAGKISDDTNPLPAIDLAADLYTELEWCLQASEDTVNGDAYEFRVTAGGTALDTYSVTPQLTIGATTTVGQNSQSIWNVRAAVGAAKQEVWNVRATVGKAYILPWNVRAAISKTLQEIWNVRSTVGKSSQEVWNVRAAISKTIILLSNVRAAVASTKQLIWNVRKTVGVPNQYIWNVRKAVGQSAQELWNVIAHVGSSSQTLWNVRSL